MYSGGNALNIQYLVKKIKFCHFWNKNVSCPNRFKTKKKSSQNVISFKSYEKSKFLKITKFTKNEKKMAHILNWTLTFHNFWPKQHFGLIFFPFNSTWFWHVWIQNKFHGDHFLREILGLFVSVILAFPTVFDSFLYLLF